MFRRMARAHHDAPDVVADNDLIAVLYAPIGVGELVDGLAEAAEAGLVVLQGVVMPTGGAIEVDGVRGRLAAGVGHQHAALQIFQPGHPQAALELAGDPAGQADVIGMQVRHEQPGDRRAAQRAREHLSPGLRGLVGLHAGVDERPAIAIADGPDVDEGQRSAKRHAHPKNARRDFDGLAELRAVLQRIDQGRPALDRRAVLRSIRHVALQIAVS